MKPWVKWGDWWWVGWTKGKAQNLWLSKLECNVFSLSLHERSSESLTLKLCTLGKQITSKRVCKTFQISLDSPLVYATILYKHFRILYNPYNTTIKKNYKNPFNLQFTHTV